jgi:hypothetical protein
MVDQAVQLGTRGSDLAANPAGTVLSTDVRWSMYSFYATDSWHILPTLTINYGLNWGVDVPAQEATGKQIIAVLAGNDQTLDSEVYLQQRQQAALNGQVYNPLIGMMLRRRLARESTIIFRAGRRFWSRRKSV